MKQTDKCGPVGQVPVGKKVVESRGKAGKTVSEMIGAKKVEGPSIK